MSKMNLMGLMSLKQQFGKAKEAHPELVKFGAQCAERGLVPGTVFSILAVTPDGTHFEVQSTLTDEDLKLIRNVFEQ